jgi:phage terminase large subunit-like protein
MSHQTWVQDLIEECAGFPNGMNDDQVDALSQALNWLRGRRTRGSISVANFDDVQPGVLAYIDQW